MLRFNFVRSSLQMYRVSKKYCSTTAVAFIVMYDSTCLDDLLGYDYEQVSRLDDLPVEQVSSLEVLPGE